MVFAVMAVAVGTIGVWRARRASVEPLAPRELVSTGRLRSELLLTNGHLTLIGSSNYFSGTMLERYPDGTLKSRSTVTNGLLHGFSEGWYTNGQLQVTEHFKEGVSHGLRVKWHPNGHKASEAQIVEGQLNGRFVSWFETGTLATELELKQGRPDGRSRAYYPSGTLKSEVTMHDGEIVTQKNWADGEFTPKQADRPPTR